MEQHDTASLNDLIEVLNDGKDFYREAAEKVQRKDLADLFNRLASHKTEVAGQLAVAVQNLGEKPAAAGTFTGSIRKVYADLRAQMAHDKDYEYVAQLEEFEDRIIHGFKDATAKTHDAIVRKIADQYFSTVKADHDLMRNLKHLGAPRS